MTTKYLFNVEVKVEFWKDFVIEAEDRKEAESLGIDKLNELIDSKCVFPVNEEAEAVRRSKTDA